MSDVTGGEPGPTSAQEPREGALDADHRWPILMVIVLALVFAAVVDRISDDGGTAAVAEVAGPEIPAPGSLSNAWYCALGSSTPDATVPETLVITNLGARVAQASVTVMPGGGGQSATRDVTLPARSQTRVPVADVLATTDPGVVVETFGGPAVVEHQVLGNGDIATGPCATGPSSAWHFAAGTTDRDTQLWLALFNPFGDDAIVDLSFLTDGGFLAPGDLQGIVVPRRTRVMVPLHDSVRRQATVATQLQTRTGRVVAEQMSVRGSDPKGLAVSLGTPQLSSQWTFPVSGFGSGDFVAIANPQPSPARVTVRTRLDGEATLAPQVVVVPSRAAVTVDVGARIPAGLGAWVGIDAHGTRVVAEQTLTLPPNAFATSLATATPARRWAFASGRVGADTADAIVVANAGDRVAQVTLHVLRDGRDDTPQPTLRVPPGRRVAFDLTGLGVAEQAGIVIDATQPVTAARQGAGSVGATVSPGIPGNAAVAP